jgi:hypothetical protein
VCAISKKYCLSKGRSLQKLKDRDTDRQRQREREGEGEKRKETLRNTGMK